MLHVGFSKALLRLRTSRQEAALLLVTMVWGITFLAVQHAMSFSGPFFFVALRFGTAALLTALLSGAGFRRLRLREVGAGVAIGIAIFAGYSLQTMGLQTIASSKAAFITALYVPMVPLLQWALWRRPPHAAGCFGIALAFTGLVLLAGPGTTGIALSSGEAVSLLGTVAIAAEIILIGRFAGRIEVRRVTSIQLAVAALLAAAAMPLAGEALPPFSWPLLLLGCGLGLASAMIQLAMNWAQKSVSPTRATLIYAGEPVWAGLAGRLAGERLPVLALLGAAFILAGLLAGELKLTPFGNLGRKRRLPQPRL